MIGKKNKLLSRRNSAKNWLKKEKIRETTFRQLEEKHKEEGELKPMESKQVKERREEAKEQKKKKVAGCRISKEEEEAKRSATTTPTWRRLLVTPLSSQQCDKASQVKNSEELVQSGKETSWRN